MAAGFSQLVAGNAHAQSIYEAVNATTSDNIVTSNGVLSLNTFGANATVGWAFTPAQNLEVSSLGGLLMADIPASPSPVTVGLWTASGTLLSSVVLGSGSQTINGSLYESISPVLINAGSTYIIAVGSGGDFDFAGVPASKAQSLLDFSGAAESSGSGFSFPAIQPISSDTDNIYGGTFLFEPVPEPGWPGLLAVGGIGLAWSRRFFRRTES